MTPPNRQTTGGRAYLDLRAKAKREGRPTDELLLLYILERFLYRLSISEHRNRLVLKGGMLLAALDARRPTADVDRLAHAITNDVASIAAVAREVLSVSVNDGVTFEQDGLRGETIRDAELYSGVRIVVPAHIDRARHPLRLDINVGDPVTPAPVMVRYPALLGEPFELLGYPLATVLAEKIVTMVDRGNTTTRDLLALRPTQVSLVIKMSAFLLKTSESRRSSAARRGTATSPIMPLTCTDTHSAARPDTPTSQVQVPTPTPRDQRKCAGQHPT